MMSSDMGRSRMKNKYLFVVVLLAVILVAGTGLTTVYMKQQQTEPEKEELTVVTSFYPVYIAAENVIGDVEGIQLSNLSEPQTGCLHDYQLTAEDMKLLSTADVFIVNGGGIETFLADVAAQYPNLFIIDMSEGIELMGENAHVWMCIEKHISQIEYLTEKLSVADSVHDSYYRQNADIYMGKLQKLAEKAKELKQSMTGQSLVIFHEAYEYLAEDYGFTVAGILNLDEERQVSAGEVADILSQIRKQNVSVILAEELYGKDMGDMMESETGVKVLYLNTLVRGDYEADSYLKGMEQNIRLLQEMFGGNP